MPDDERESDDLFEDLDKFFAPIKDVDWDDPEEAPSDRRTIGGRARRRPDRARTRRRRARGRGGRRGAGDGVRRRGRRRRRLVRHRFARAGRAGTRGLGRRRRARRAGRGSGGAGGSRRRASRSLRPARRGRGRGLRGGEEGARPSEAELEEAAAHFADSLGEEGGVAAPPPRVVQIDEDSADDLMEELGAEPYPAEEAEDEDVFAAMAEEDPSRTIVVGTEGLGGPELAGAGRGRGRSRPRQARDGARRAGRVPHGHRAGRGRAWWPSSSARASSRSSRPSWRWSRRVSCTA